MIEWVAPTERRRARSPWRDRPVAVVDVVTCVVLVLDDGDVGFVVGDVLDSTAGDQARSSRQSEGKQTDRLSPLHHSPRSSTSRSPSRSGDFTSNPECFPLPRSTSAAPVPANRPGWSP
jgi:hypothetical protein